MFKRIRIAFRVLWRGEEAIYAVVQERIKQNRDIEYLKMMQENRLALSAKDQANKERDSAVDAMHMVASDALMTIKNLEAALAKKTGDQTLDRFLSLHRKKKDDLPD
jgi:hypothetical protein